MDWQEYINLLVKKSKNQGIPCSACFELTPFCNFNCNMCYIHLSQEQAKQEGELLTTDQWIRIAEDAKSNGTLGIELTGGEAITRPDFKVLYETFVKMGFLITLRSNGYLISGEVFDLLKKYKPRCISITLYGGSNETYYKITGVRDGFSVVTKNVLALRDAGFNIKLSVTVTKDNIDDRDKLIKWAEENELYLGFYGGLLTPIRAAKRSIDHLKVDYGLEQYVKDDLPARNINYADYKHPFWMCKEYGTKYCISWDGRMTLCNCLPSIWADPLSQPFKDAFDSLYDQLEKLNRPEECAKCQYIDYCGACPAHLLSETGSLEHTCEDLCKNARVNYYFSQKNTNDAQLNKTDKECNI